MGERSSWRDRYPQYGCFNRWPSPLPLECPIPLHTPDLSQIGLLALLPIEIRLQIWRLVLGSRTMYLRHERLTKQLRPSASNLTLPQKLKKFGNASNGTLSKAVSLGGERRPQLIALLKTCRWIYGEALELLYSSNTFATWGMYDLTTFRVFTEIIRPGCLASIRSLSVAIPMVRAMFEPNAQDVEPVCSILTYFEISELEHHDIWMVVCEIMATRMPGLKNLRLDLYKMPRWTHWDPSVLDVNLPWIQPILKLRGLKRFEMGLELGDWDGVSFDPESKYCRDGRDFVEDMVVLQNKVREAVCAEPES